MRGRGELAGAATLRCKERRSYSSPGTEVSSGLDGRESAFELHASGGQEVWRRRLWVWFERCNELANGVQQLLEVTAPPIDLTKFQKF